MKYVIFFVLLVSTLNVWASDANFWSIEIGVPKYAVGIERTENERFFTKIVRFEVRDIQPKELEEYYARFFGDLGWKDPMAEFADRSGMMGEWAGYNIRFNSDGKPEAAYGKSWQATTLPATGNLSILLTSYSTSGFSGKVTVAISPSIDMSSLMQVHELLGNDPRNIFVLYDAIGSNPLEIHTVSLTEGNPKAKNPLVQEYYRILESVEAEYSAFGIRYVSK